MCGQPFYGLDAHSGFPFTSVRTHRGVGAQQLPFLVKASCESHACLLWFQTGGAQNLALCRSSAGNTDTFTQQASQRYYRGEAEQLGVRGCPE